MTENSQQRLPTGGGDQDADPPDSGIPGPIHPEDPAEGPDTEGTTDGYSTAD